MNDKNNIIKQAKHDIHIALQGILKTYNIRGVSYSTLKKYYKKKGNFKDLLEDIKNKGINLFDNEKEYQNAVKEVLMNILNDKIAYEKDKNENKNMKHIKLFEDVYYEPKPEPFGVWKTRVKKILEEFTAEYIEENIGLEACDFWVEVEQRRILISVGYKKGEKYEGLNKEMVKKEWESMMDDMIIELETKFDYDFTPHHLSVNGYMVEYDIPS